MATAAVGEVHLSFPIEKFDRTDDGDLVVYGPCTDGSVDADHQRVKPGWSGKALQDWIETGGNVRVQHSPFLYPAGKGMALEVDKARGQHWLKALVVEDTAKRLVEKGVLRDFSVGILDPVITFTDPTAPGGTIVGGRIGEVSLVDRGSNKNTTFQLVKAAKDGPAEIVNKVFGAPPPTPADLRRDDYLRHNVFKRQLKDGKVVDSGGRDVSDLDDADFAGPGKTFPIKNRADVGDAAGLAHHADDPAQVRSSIRSIAHRKFGMGDADMPESLRENKAGNDADADDDGTPNKSDAADGMKTCLKCKTKNDSGAKRCKGCGKKLGMVIKADAAQDGAENADSEDDDDEYDDSSGPDSSSSDDPDSDDDGPPDTKAKNKALKALLKAQRKELVRSIKANPGGAHRGDSGGRDPSQVAGGAKDKTSVPAGKHREPDGAVTEGFEHDAGMHVDKAEGDPAMATMQRLHDAVCPALREKQVRRTHALKSVGDAMPVEELQGAAVAAINDGNLSAANYFLDMAQSASAIKRIDRGILMHARKAYPELFPSLFQAGIDDRPAAHQDVDPGMFTRGYVSAGHPSLSASAGGGSGLPGAPVHHVDAADFTRGYVGAGHQSPSPGEGRQATSSTAVMGQAMTTMQRLHEQVASGWPDLCTMNVERHNYTQGDGGTGLRPSPMGSASEGGNLLPAPGEPGHQVRKDAAEEPEVRRILAKAQRKIRDLEEEVSRLGAMPDPLEAPYRGLPELGGPVDRHSYIDKAAGAGSSDDLETDEYLRFVGSFANGGDPTMRQNARKVLKGLLAAGKEG